MLLQGGQSMLDWKRLKIVWLLIHDHSLNDQVLTTLRAANEVIALIATDTKTRWCFHRPAAVTQELSIESEIFNFHLWSDAYRALPDLIGSNFSYNPVDGMLVIVQPPWILPEQNFKDFCACTEVGVLLLTLWVRLLTTSSYLLKFPSFNPRETLPSRHRLWARVRTVIFISHRISFSDSKQIWDLCTRLGVRYFVLTTMDNWAFGMLSSGVHSYYIILEQGSN
jgi:hypothetical protein